VLQFKAGFPVAGVRETYISRQQEARLAEVAGRHGMMPERLVTSTVVRYLGEEARFLAAVEKGMAAAARGEFTEEEDMDARVRTMLPA
jgi:predicted transcriptional regulator